MNQSPLKQWIITAFLLCEFLILQAHQESVQGSIVFAHNDVSKESVAQCFPEKVVIGAISFEADIALQQEEFAYTLGFSAGDSIDRLQIEAALERFAKKNKFLTIAIAVDIDDFGVRLHFIFESIWTLRKIKLHHVYQGKHALAQLYLMERGDAFDESKHNHSLTKIRDFLTSCGYYCQSVKSYLEYNQTTKEVIAHITVKKGKCFSFGVVDIEIVCDEGIDEDPDDIRNVINKKFLQSLSSQSFTKDLLNSRVRVLKDYLAKKGFLYSAIEIEENINYQRSAVDIKLKINIHQKREIVFFGHRFFSKKQLLDTVLAFGQSVWLMPATLLVEEIEKVYKSKGFLNIEVAAREEKERSFFVIKEGPRAVITDAVIKNVAGFELLHIKKTFFSKLLKHAYYDAQLCDEAINHLLQFYIKEGFLSSTIASYECVATENENEYVFMVTIDEGAKKYITSLLVEGYAEFDECGPFKRSEYEGKIFTTATLEECRAWLMKQFRLQGYMHPRLKYIIESLDDDRIAIKWIVDPGEPMHFGTTIMQGALTFPFKYLEQFLFYKQGDVWDQEKIKQSFRALKDLEIFETIHFLPDYTDGSQDKPVLLRLHLDDRYEVRTRAGLELQHVRKYQTFSGVTYKIGGTALVKNLSNCADQLRFDCDFARSHREIVGKYRRPWFTKNPFFTTLQVYSIVYDQPGFRVNSSVNDVYTLIQNGFLLGLQKKNQYFDVDWNNGCEWMKLHIQDNEEQLSFAHAIDFEPQLIDKTVPFFFTEPTIIFERLDNALNPTQGGVGLFSLKAMIPLLKKYKDSFFLKLLFEQSFFMPIKSVVAAFRFRCGHIFYREFSGIMPSERFYLGGSHSLRGYEADLAPPLGVFVDSDGKEHVVPRGGRTMFNANAELRFPIWKKIGGVVFQDIGALSGTMFSDFRTQDLLASTGFGVRVFTPLGPLRFDIGWRWRKQLAIERSFAWFLTFGQAF